MTGFRQQRLGEGILNGSGVSNRLVSIRFAIYLADHKERNSPKPKQRKLTDDENFARHQLK